MIKSFHFIKQYYTLIMECIYSHSFSCWKFGYHLSSSRVHVKSKNKVSLKGLTYLHCKKYEFKNWCSAKRSMIDDKKIKGRREKRLTHFLVFVRSRTSHYARWAFTIHKTLNGLNASLTHHDQSAIMLMLGKQNK